MPTIGFDAQIILDSTGYFIAPDSYVMQRPKKLVSINTRGTPVAGKGTVGAVIRPTLPPLAEETGGVPVKILDRGPNQRLWTMDVLCTNTLKRYDGSAMGPIGQQLRDALHHSYDKVNTLLNFTTPHGITFQVAFTSLVEKIADLRTQVLGIDYTITITLVEAA